MASGVARKRHTIPRELCDAEVRDQTPWFLNPVFQTPSRSGGQIPGEVLGPTERDIPFVAVRRIQNSARILGELFGKLRPQIQKMTY